MNGNTERNLKERRHLTEARIASAEWQRDPVWTSPQLRRYAAEATGDREAYDALIAGSRFGAR